MNQHTYEILIIGAGASGLMAARELSHKGKQVILLEARERTGGRIDTADPGTMGYPAEKGAEFVHGNLPLTKSLIQEAGLTMTEAEGEMWDVRDGVPQQSHEFVPEWNVLIKKLKEVKEDLPIAQFLDQHFPKEKYAKLRKAITGFIEGFDAADPSRASTLALRDEWTTENESKQFRIREGYGALISFLEKKCRAHHVEIILNSPVVSVDVTGENVVVRSSNGASYHAEKVMVTVPLHVLKTIIFVPALPSKMEAIDKIGFGKVIKFLLHFKSKWWTNAYTNDLSKLGFIFSNEKVPTWWTQYPEEHFTLTGWLAGPKAELYLRASKDELKAMAVSSLAKIFNTSSEFIEEQLLHSLILNWGEERFSLGAYAYATPDTTGAKAELLKPVNNRLFFSGEALYEGKEMGTVEAALASGKKTAATLFDSPK